MLDFLPQNVKNAMKNLNFHYLYELRIRANQAIIVNYDGNYRYLGEYGLTERAENAISCSITDIQDCVYRAGNYSVYSVEEQLKQGFLTAESGERLGIAGRFVYVNGQPAAVRDFSSLCIRVPHSIVGCSTEIYEKCLRMNVVNLLILSPPGQGKTTILRDLSRNLSERKGLNLLVCDERGEIASGEVGKTADVYAFAAKKDGLEMGVRVMRPDVIITDEISECEVPAMARAINSGVKMIASFHAKEVAEIPLSLRNIFEKAVVLDGDIIGKIKEIISLKEI
jgi:stage III sporulation protein AA